MHASIHAVFSLFFLPLSFFHSFSLFFLLLVFLLLSCRGLFPLWSFLFLGPFLWVHPPLSASLRCLLLSYYRFLPLGTSSVSSMAISSFYSELIQWDFSFLVLRFHQLFFACCGHSFRTARPLPLLRIRLLHHYSFLDKIPFCLFLLHTFTSRFKWIRIGLPHYLPLWHASDGPNHLLPLLGKIPSQ